jgi:hypothetical protein
MLKPYKVQKTPASKLAEGVLYLGDNGRCFCGKLRCAGMTAHFSGRDLSGQRVLTLSAASIKRHGFRCEGCGVTGESK